MSAFSAEPPPFNSAALPQVTSWIGNTYPGARKWVQQDIEALAVTNNGTSVGHLEPGEEVGKIGLQDIRECLAAHRRADGEFLVFLEDDYKSKILIYRLKPGQLK